MSANKSSDHERLAQLYQLLADAIERDDADKITELESDIANLDCSS